MQMSATRVFILVEGRQIDTYFYSEIGRRVCASAGLSYEIVRADRVGESGGKGTLMELHEFLYLGGSLIDRSKGSETWCFFYLDKDVDDILCKQIESKHVVYTPFYSVENVLFIYGDLVRGAAAAASLDAARVGLRIPNSEAWRREKAELWKDFVTLCLFSQKYRINCDCHYGRNTSPLNNPADTEADAEEVAARMTALEGLSGLPGVDFDRKFRASARLVRRVYGRGEHDILFNGKWYRELLMREIEIVAQGEQYNRHALANGITASLAATLDFDSPWAEYFGGPLRKLVEAEADGAVGLR